MDDKVENILARLMQVTFAAATNGRALGDIGAKDAGSHGEVVARGLLLQALRNIGYASVIESFAYINDRPQSAALEVRSPANYDAN